MRTTFLLFAAFAATAIAGPTGQRSTCALHCTESDKFNYETGKSYVYDYSVTTSSALLGTFDDDAKMKITAKAMIDVLSPCDFALKLSEVHLEGSSHDTEFSEAIMSHPLRFSFQDGVVESLCSEVSEPTWVLNFKRGILSTFQNSMNNLNHKEVQETDISGMCTAHYDVTTEGNTVSVEKTKDLTSCTQRPDLTAYIMSTSYATNSPVQSLPIFKSTNKCHQTIEGGLLKEADCEETHKFRPFSNDEGGAVTTIKTTMHLTSQEQLSEISPDFQYSTTSLVFGKESTSTSETKTAVVEKILNDLQAATEGEVQAVVPALFSNLVSSLKYLDYPQMSNIYNKFQDPHVRKFLIDAIPLVGTASAAGTFRDMVMNGDITKEEADPWFTSLAFMKNPNTEIFIAIAPMLEGNPSQQAMLGTSALINNYCKLHADCEKDSGVVQVIRRIEAQLGSSCRTINDEEKTRTLVALKALGNAGRWVNANSVLRRCYTEDDNSMEIRVAALEAWRHTPCEYDRSNILAAFQDETQDPEVRIAAYLALMSCPSETLINILKDRLTSEGVNQVGSFVWTHLTNLQESASPEKQWMHELIGEELLQNKFNTDALKFSRNYESSFFMNELNTGATVESNVIFSSKSFLPRSAMLNLTLDLFGESINFFEVGGRIEGFETYVERFFGPNGYFPEETVEGIIRNMREQKVDHEPTTLEGFLDRVTDEPEGSYYLRVFGNELHYHHFQGLENLIRSSGAANPLEFLMDLARKGDVDYTKSYQLFDTHYTIPTVSGLPLALTATGTATLGIKMNGQFRAKSLKNIDIEGHFHPSAAVEIDGLMLVDAHVSKTGLKMTSNLHTSTFLDGKVQINKGKLVDIAFNTPKDKVEVINVQSKFFYLENDAEIEKAAENQISYEGCTKGTTGIALCGEYSYTPRTKSSPMFPFVGPFATHIYFKKTDTHTSYQLQFERQQNQITFMADTPGSQNDHLILAKIEKLDNSFALDLQTPFTTAKGNGEYTWQTKNKSGKITLNLDGQQYGIETSFAKDPNNKQFEHSLVVTAPEGILVEYKGLLKKTDGATEIAFGLKTPVIEGEGKTQFNYDPNALASFTTDLEYKLKNGPKKTLHESLVLKKEIINQATTYSLNFEFTPSDSYYATKMNLKTTMSNLRHIESTCKLVLGSVTWEAEQLWMYTTEGGHKKINNELSIKSPQQGVDLLSSFKLIFNKNSVQTDLHLRTSPENDMSLSASLMRNKNIEISGNIALEMGEFKFAFDGKYNKIAAGHHKVQFITKIRDDTCLLEGTFKDNSSRGKVNVVLEGLCKYTDCEITSNLNIYADKTRATVDMKTNANGQEYTAKLEGTSSSILMDINIIKHILLNAYVTSSGETNKLLINAEWDKDVDPTKTFVIDTELSTKAVLVNLKFMEREFALSSKLVKNGAELEAKWASDKRVFCTISYKLGETTTLGATVQTPFPGWEKQDATFNLLLKDREIESKFVATWKNSEQISLNIKGNVQPGMFSNGMAANILFSSTFDHFERINFSLEHSMNYMLINSKFEGAWGDKQMQGDFELSPEENGLKGHLKFVSPFTQDLLVTLSHKLMEKSLDSTIEAKYGTESAIATLKGHVDLSSSQEVTLVFKLITPFENIPLINTNINYKNDGSALKMVIDGVMGDKKVMVDMNGSLVRGETINVKGDLRVITPLTYPFTASFNHQHNAQTFTSELEMSRIWSSYGNLKMHAEGQMASKDNIRLSAVLSSPANKASLSFIHNISDKKMASSIDISLNAEHFHGSANGVIDRESNLAKVSAEITSTFNGLDDIKVNIESEKSGDAQISRIMFTKGEKSVTIDHIITVTDILNWENSFKVNSKYILINKQTQVGNNYNHELTYKWDSEVVHMKIDFGKQTSGNNHEIHTQLVLETPWTNTLKGDITVKYNKKEYTPIIVVEYAPGKKIEITSTIKSEDTHFYIESTLVTPFWQDLGYKVNIVYKPRPAVTVVLIRGNNKTTINVGGMWESGKLDGTLEIHTTYLTLPVSMEASYDIKSQEKSGHLTITYDKKYEIRGSLSGNTKAAKWSLMTEIPIEIIHHLEFSGEYNVMEMPLKAKSTLLVNSKKYEINGQLNVNDFNIDLHLDGQQGGLTGNWLYSHTKANLNIKFESPLNMVDNFSFYVMYNFVDEKKVNVKLTKGDKEINLTGRMEDETLLFDGITPFSGWETLNASFFMSESAINAFVSRNDRKIEVTGTLHVKPAKGKILLVVNTPYANFKEISTDLIYSFQGPVKKIEFKSTFGSKQILANGVINVTDGLAPEMKLDITTPFDIIKKVGGLVQWNFKTSTKTAVIEAHRNSNEYKWELEATTDNLFKGHAATKIRTPISGWTSLTIEGNFDVTSMPYQFIFEFEKEGVKKVFTGSLNIDRNSISSELVTPITNWEKILVTGDYTLEENHLTFTTDISRNTEKYQISSDILFNTQKPKLNMAIKTPFTYASNIELEVDSNLVDANKKFFTSLKVNENQYSIDFDGELVYKKGHMKLSTISPIPGFTSLEFFTKFDFTDDVKVAEIDFKREGQNQHVSIKTRINDNNVFIEVQTPLSGYETLQFTGDYTEYNSEHVIQATYMKNSQKYDLKASILPEDLSASFEMSTPIESMKKINMRTKFTLLESGTEGSVHFEKDNESFDFNTLIKFTFAKSDLVLSLKTPVRGYKKLNLNAHYDVLSEKKTAEVVFQKGSMIKKVSVEGSYNLKSGSFKIETPVNGFEKFGAKYSLSLNERKNQLDSTVTFYHESNEWSFAAQGEYQLNKIMIKFTTPFEGFQTIALIGNIDFDNKMGEGMIEFGAYKFTIDTSYVKNNMFIKINTPFDNLKIISVSAKHLWTADKKEADLTFVYNEKEYTLKGILNLSKDSSEIQLQALTPFQSFENLTVKAKYDINNRDELFAFQITANPHTYGFKMGGYIEEKVALFTIEATSPFSGWSTAKFIAKVDLTLDDKHLEVVLEKDGNIKAISIDGKIIGETVGFNLKTPFTGLNNLKMFGSLNRSKRSLEFQMMSDSSAGSLQANFHSVSLELKTPFDVAQEIKWELTKVNDGTYKAEWKRNDNYITINLEKLGRKAAFKVEVKSEFQGWEFLALTGRLDRETLQGYISGALNEEKISISGSGVFDTKGKFDLHVETPYDNYKSVEVHYEYNSRKKTLKLEASSSSSDFHFILERDRSGIIKHHSIFPNAQQPTEISMNLGIYQGKVTITSRFPALRDYYQEYNANINFETVTVIDHIIKVNGNDIFKMDVKRDRPNKKFDAEIIIHGSNDYRIEIHRDGYSSLHFLANVNGKEFKVDVEGSGNLPTQGDLNIDIHNSFRRTPRHVKAHINFDIGSDDKHIKAEVTFPQRKLYVFDLHYNMSSRRNGEFTLKITTPDRSNAIWKNVSGSWDTQDRSNTIISLEIGGTKYTATGKLTLRESTLVLTSDDRSKENIFLQWKFVRNGDMRDYFLKLGRESRYGMLKLSGTITDYIHVDLKGGFKAGPFMPQEFHFTTKWNGETRGAVTGGGSFEYGRYHGEHTVSFDRNSERRSATFEASGTSNVPGYERVSLSGSYDFYHKAVVHVVLNANDRESKLDINFDDISPLHSHNTIDVNIPIFETYGKMQLTFSHDFREPTAKSISAVANFGDREAYVKANWNRNANFDKLEGNIDIKSRFIGEAHIKVDFDVSNIRDSHMDVTYSRTTRSGETKNASLKMSHKRTSSQMHSEIVIDTPYGFLSHGRIYADADFNNNFKLSAGADYNEKHVTFELEIKKKSISGKITSPFNNFELLQGTINYNLTGKSKNVHLEYERGARKVNMDFTLNVKPKKEGDFDLKLTTPFDFVKNLHIDGKWSKKKAEINYQRNDNVYNFQGKADIKADKSSFDMTFAPPGRSPIRVAGSYDVAEFLEGSGSADKKIVGLELEFEDNSFTINVHGYRNSERVYLEIDGTSSFARIKRFHVKLDSQLNAQKRDGHFEIQLNDFEFKVDNHFERTGRDQYYFKSHIESTLTPLPALIFGIGRKGEERIVTLGYGEDNEITFSIKGKDNFRSGFSGHVDIPNFGYEGVEYEVEYHFENRNELHIDIDAKLGSDEEVEAHFIYNSEGVQARLNSLRSGSHSLRVRRSISSDGFFAEAGFDDYNVKLRGGFDDDDTKRGFLLEGEVFGKKFMLDTLLQSEGLQYTEGKLILKTPFQGWENLGGLFTWSYVDNKIISHAEVMLPCYTLPKITAEINLNMNKKIVGHVTVDLAGEEFSLKTNLIGTRAEGLKGSIELYTPFRALSYVSVNGNIKMADSQTFESDLKISAPSATHEIKFNYKLDLNKVVVDATLISTRLENIYNMAIKLEKTDLTSGVANVKINEHELTAQYKLQKDHFKMNIDTLVNKNRRQFSIDMAYASLTNLDGTLIVILDGQTHKIHGKMNVQTTRVEGVLEVESAIVEGQRKLAFDIQVPNPSFSKFSYHIDYITEQKHSINFDFDATSGIHVKFIIDSPLVQKIAATVDITGATAGFTLETPQGTHKLLGNWKVTRKMPSDYEGNLELSSPLLPVDYKLDVILAGNQGSRKLKAQLFAGTVKHVLEANASMSNNGGSFALNIDTPIRNINKASIEVSLNFGSKIVMQISGMFKNKVNTFNLSFDKQSKEFSSTLESPFIPTGMVMVEAQLTGEINRNMQAKITLKNNKKSISGVFNVNVISVHNIKTNLKIITPFKGYKKMNFNVQYVKSDDNVTIVILTEKPVKFNAELHLENMSDNIKADLKIDTEIKSFENIEGHMVIPVNTFEPQVSANVMIDGDHYGGNFGLRTKAPYELSYGLRWAQQINSKFHLRTDSSFLSFLA